MTGRDRQRGIILFAVLWSIALLSGLCAGGSLVGGILDVANGDASVSQALGPILPFLLVSLPFLAGG